jgi:hypothetical protein
MVDNIIVGDTRKLTQPVSVQQRSPLVSYIDRTVPEIALVLELPANLAPRKF